MAEEAKVKFTDASVELEDMARAAAHAKFAEWHKQERDQQPRRILMFTLAAIVITVATSARSDRSFLG